MTSRALLAADCGSGVGLGHLERMLALAEALQPDIEAYVLIPQGDPTLRRRVAERGFNVLELPGSAGERAAAASVMDVTVLDGYVYDVTLQRCLRGSAPLTVVDDLQLPADCDLAVNPSPGGESMRPAGAGAFLGGASYALLRASFLEARELVERDGRPRRTVLVSTGATDLDSIGESVTRELLATDATVEVIRVVGPDAHAERPDGRSREHRILAPPSLADVLTRATVYVGAAGTTAVQAACVGVPAVITAAVPNQVSQAAALEASGCAVVADASRLAEICLQLLDDAARCRAMSERGRKLVDGGGAGRVAGAVRELIAARAA